MGRRGILCVLEGIDGSGKSTVARILTESLRREGIRVATFKQPSELPSGLAVKRIARSTPFSHSLRSALRKDRLAQAYKLLLPALRTHEVIICDRYFHSAIYQYRTRRALRSALAALPPIVPHPDITFLIMPSALRACSRISSGRGRLDLFEQKIALFRNRYSWFRGQQRTVLITENLSAAEIARCCRSTILARCSISPNQSA